MRPSQLLLVSTSRVLVRKMAGDAVQCHKSRFSVNENGWSVVTEGKAEVRDQIDRIIYYNYDIY